MSAKHTPGPWRIGYPDGSGAGPETFCIVRWGRKGTETVIFSSESFGSIYGVTTSGNARLIAAAPDLLAILKRYVAEVPLGHQPHMLAQGAEAAIAKAEGRDNGKA